MRWARLRLDPPQISSGANGYGTASGFASYKFFLPTGIALKELELIGNNINNDQVRKVELSLNGDVTHDVTGEFLRILAAYKGEYQEDGVFILPFADFSQTLQQGQNFSQLVLLDGDNAVLTVEVAEATPAQVNANAVASMRGTYISSPQPPEGRVYLPRMFSETFNGSVAGENRYTNFANQRKSSRPTSIKRAHLIGDNIAELELKRSGRTIFERRRDDWNREVQRWGLSPQSIGGKAVYHFDPTVTGLAVADRLDTDGTFEIITELTQPGAFTAIYETIELIRAPNPTGR